MLMSRDIAVPAASRAVQGDILAPLRDPEVSSLLAELNHLQTWCVLLSRTEGSRAISAADLVQRTRILIIERCKK